MLTDDMGSEASPHIGLWWYGNCKTYDLPKHACIHLLNLHWHSSSWPPRKSMVPSYYSIDWLKDTAAMSVAVFDCWTIREWDVQVEGMTWYMISCRCGLILIRSVMLWYLTCMYTITKGIRGILYQAHSVWLAIACMHTTTNVSHKAPCYQNHGKEVWVRMCKHPNELSIKRLHCSGNEKDKLQQRDRKRYLPAEGNLYLLLTFYDTYIYCYKIY